METDCWKKLYGDPSFIDQTKTGMSSHKKGFTFIYSNQCPFMDEYVATLANLSKNKKIPTEIKKLKNHKEAQNLGSPFSLAHNECLFSFVPFLFD
ncbi:hypothetical protein [Leptospira wolbachii]|uniref:hypothetical protein n=1 Tax=Leptospira wolbachii TaxID=29511 RepID=UPI000590A937|nr:hypothetical protein [Leptospira wolbachii]